MGELLELVHFVIEGGFSSFLVVIVAVACTAIAVERWIRIQFQYSVNSRAFMAKLKKYILSDNIDRAISLCNSKSSALLPRVMKAGLTRAKDSVEEIQTALEEATLEALPKLEARSLYLPTLANMATLLGLFGTIVGLITAFRAGDAVDAAARQAFLQKSIAVAMHTTALGIFVAIPALIVNAILQSKITMIVSDIDQFSVKLVNLLTASKKSGGRAMDDDEDATPAPKKGKKRSSDDDEDAAANDD